jgi:hypothetical protein
MNKHLLMLLIGAMLILAVPAPAVAGGPPASKSDDIPESFGLIAENANFRLYLNSQTLAFKVVDKRSGYIWHSNLDERGPDDRLNRTWTAFAQSGISIDYLDQKANAKRASITLSEHTLEIQPLEDGIRAQVTFPEAAISVGIIIRLEDTGVRVEVPFDSIRQSGDFRLHLLHLYPWMGATRGDQTPGYMFIPDGCGSIIRFAAQTKAANMYYGRYYGEDLGMLEAFLRPRACDGPIRSPSRWWAWCMGRGKMPTWRSSKKALLMPRFGRTRPASSLTSTSSTMPLSTTRVTSSPSTAPARA